MSMKCLRKVILILFSFSFFLRGETVPALHRVDITSLLFRANSNVNKLEVIAWLCKCPGRFLSVSITFTEKSGHEMREPMLFGRV